MKTDFNNLIELFDYFGTEEKCIEFLEFQRWEGNVECPHCGHGKVYRTNRGFKCASKDCYKKFSVTVGTVFENSKIKLRYWFAAIYLCTNHKKGISSHQLARDLGVKQHTAWFMLHRIREIMADKAPEVLKDVVEVDETFVGGKNKNRHADKKVPESQGRSVKDKTAVIGMVQRGGKVKAQKVPDTKGSTLLPIIEANVAKGSIVCTDEWGGYRSVRKAYEHYVIKHGEGQYVNGQAHTNTIEGFWSLLKRGIVGIYHNVSEKHLDRYCTEFSYRYNSREIKDVQRFSRMLTHAEGRLKYRDLKATA